MAYVKFQVKSSGQWLNSFEVGTPSGTKVCQGDTPTTPNFLWAITDAGIGSGWCLFQEQDTGMYLNIQGGGNANATPAVKAPLPNPRTDNFLWKIIPDQNNPGWSKIQVKSSLQFLNIRDGGSNNGQPACQGDTPNTTNFQWMQYNTVARPVTVMLNLKNCEEIFKLGNGTTVTTLNQQNAGSYLSITDNNNGHLEDPRDIISFETLLNPGSLVTWQPIIASGDNNNGYTAKITAITFEQGTGNNVLKDVSSNPNDGTAHKQVEFTAIPPASGDNEAYSISFTLTDGTGTDKRFIIDPKIKINPSN